MSKQCAEVFILSTGALFIVVSKGENLAVVFYNTDGTLKPSQYQGSYAYQSVSPPVAVASSQAVPLSTSS